MAQELPFVGDVVLLAGRLQAAGPKPRVKLKAKVELFEKWPVGI